MIPRIDAIKLFTNGLLRSYSQIFFSESYWFGIPLLLVSFLDIKAGICGVLSVVTANLASVYLKFDTNRIQKGLYGFNSLLVGLGLGYHYELTLQIGLIAIIAGFLTLLFTIALQGIIGKYYLPYLSLPFLVSIWIILPASKTISGVFDNESGVFILNKLFGIGGLPLVSIHNWWIENVTSNLVNGYFMSLGAIFFQFNILAGIVVAISLISFSRITFVLSVLGYAIAYLAYSFLGIELNKLGYGYIGFNFILTAIAIGGYFYIPSKQTFLWATLISPVIAVVAAGVFLLNQIFGLPVYSLPFNIIVLLFIYTLRFRTTAQQPLEVQIQEGSPEKNLYSFQSFSRRFPKTSYIPVYLPFWGEWTVSQGHNGEHTHKDNWAEAWDFVITDRNGNQFNNDGTQLSDYYCYGKTIISPADGSIVEVEDGIDDNNPGNVNINKNWGNTLIIKHADNLYSKLSHLQKGSITVKKGDLIKKGQIVGKVGNSGRSPFPHLHFQMQANPYIGSHTLRYPLTAYILNGSSIETYDYPKVNEKVSSLEPIPFLANALSFTPGKKLSWTLTKENNIVVEEWEVMSNSYNRQYFYCKTNNSSAYFYNDGIFFYFYHFEGSRKSLLYSFYLAAFRLHLVQVKGYKLIDHLPINKTFGGIRLMLQDFISPFFIYLSSCSEVKLFLSGSEFDISGASYKSTITGKSFSYLAWVKDFTLSFSANGTITIEDNISETTAVCDTNY